MARAAMFGPWGSEEDTSLLQSPDQLLCRFFNDTATTEIYTLSLHDALPISRPARPRGTLGPRTRPRRSPRGSARAADLRRCAGCLPEPAGEAFGLSLTHSLHGSSCNVRPVGIGRGHVSTPVTRSTPMPFF